MLIPVEMLSTIRKHNYDIYPVYKEGEIVEYSVSREIIKGRYQRFIKVCDTIEEYIDELRRLYYDLSVKVEVDKRVKMYDKDFDACFKQCALLHHNFADMIDDVRKHNDQRLYDPVHLAYLKKEKERLEREREERRKKKIQKSQLKRLKELKEKSCEITEKV